MTRLAALVALLALLLTGCDDAPPAAAPPAPTTVPWWQGGALHVGATEIATPLREIVYAGGTTLVGATDAEAARWSLVRDGALVQLVRASSRVDPVVSDDGSRVVWVQATRIRQVREQVSDVTFRVVAYDVAAGRRVGTWTTRNRVTCCDAVGWLVARRVLADGSVLLYRVARDSLRWTPGQDPVEVTGRTEWSPAPVRSPDGHRIRFAVPDGDRVVAWEDDDHVVLATGRPVRFLRCDAATGACEETADRPGPHVRFPGDR